MTEQRDIACPFCGLLCDDLIVDTATDTPSVIANGCALARQNFTAASANSPSARIEGRAADHEQAIARAVELLETAQQVLFAGLATDVAGARAALQLAERCGAAFDHMNSPGLLANIQQVQTRGWMNGTFGELRNRADWVVLVGEDLFTLFPRLAERILQPPQTLFPEQVQQRRFVLIGPWDTAKLPASLAAVEPERITVDQANLPHALGLLQAFLAGHTVQPERIDARVVERLQNLAGQLQQAEYSGLVWSAADLAPSVRELLIGQLAELSRELNRSGRCMGLPLGGSQGDITVNQVCSWQTGYPVRIGFQQGYPDFDPLLYDGSRMLAEGTCDVLVWIASLTPDRLPPASSAATIVIGHPGMELAAPPSVFIPTGIPGIDHAGYLYRGDTVVAIPLRVLRQSANPSVAAVLRQLNQRLGARPC